MPGGYQFAAGALGESLVFFLPVEAGENGQMHPLPCYRVEVRQVVFCAEFLYLLCQLRQGDGRILWELQDHDGIVLIGGEPQAMAA